MVPLSPNHLTFKRTIELVEQWQRSGVLIVNLEQNSLMALLFFFADFEHIVDFDQ